MNMMDANAVNAAAMTIGAVLVVVLIVVWLLGALNHRLWHCPLCGYQTYDHAQALGHVEYHKSQHKVYEAEP